MRAGSKAAADVVKIRMWLILRAASSKYLDWFDYMMIGAAFKEQSLLETGTIAPSPWEDVKKIRLKAETLKKSEFSFNGQTLIMMNCRAFANMSSYLASAFANVAGSYVGYARGFDFVTLCERIVRNYVEYRKKQSR